MKRNILTIIILLFAFIGNAQNMPCLGGGPSGSIQILGDDNSICNDGVHLYINFTAFSGVGYPGTDSYAVVQNVYNSANYNFGSPTATNYNLVDDDTWGNVLHLPFRFCFFGKQYTAVQLGSNGQVSFDTTFIPNSFSSNTYNTQFFGPLPYNGPNASSSVQNCILTPDHDIDISVTSPGEKITYEVQGTAPCRKFIITWDSIPMFYASCNSLIASQQAVLYESTNEIEINVKKKPLCTSWIGGIAYEGIQNATNTKAFTVPGRNGTQWTDTGSSWAFVPAGAPDTNTTIYWMDSATNTVLDTGAVFNYYPTQDMAVYVLIGDTTQGQGCGNIMSPYKHLFVTGATSNINYTILDSSCLGGTVQFTALGINTTYNWNFGDGQTATGQNPPPHTYVGHGPFTVTLNTTAAACSSSVTKLITIPIPVITSAFTATVISASCHNSVVNFVNNSTGASTYLWNFGDGQTDTNANPGNHTYTSIGPFTVTLTASNPGCTPNVSTQMVTLNPLPIVINFALSSNAICAGTNISTSNYSTGSNPTYSWNMGDGSAPLNGTNINYTYNTGGNYTVTCTSTDQYGCTGVGIQTIFVDAVPECKFTLNKNPICINESVACMDVLSANTLNFNWTNGDGKSYSDIHNVETYYTQSGDYRITLYANYAVCPQQFYTQTIHVDKFPYLTLGDTIEICPNVDVITLADNNNPNATYLWSTGATANVIQVTTPNIYTVQASYGHCVSSDSILVIGNIECITQPNAFSPNGDNENDNFKPLFFNVEQVTSYSFVVYNRWGNQMYTSTNKYEKGWDGNFNGKKADADTYFYTTTIELINGKKRTFKGDVILIR